MQPFLPPTKMGKKSKRSRPNQGSNKRLATLAKDPDNGLEETADNLRFEDPFPEEYYVEEDDVKEGETGETMDTEDSCKTEGMKTWNPFSGETLAPGEELQMDPSAYKMHHALTPEWPAMSFDFIRDDLGEARTRFPHSLIVAVGSQADTPENNRLTIIKMSDLSRIHVETDDDILGEEYNPSKAEDGDSDSDDSDDDNDIDPIVEHFSFDHFGGVNRVRCMPQQPEIVASWSDVGVVNVFNIKSILQRFSLAQGTEIEASDTSGQPFFSYRGHGAEGFALDWSSVRRGHLATGDCNGCIHVWEPESEERFAVSTLYSNAMAGGRNRSVEDLQWSPGEPTVLASAECDGIVQIFDIRAKNKAMLTHKIHENGADVNVLSWNKLVKNLIATGGDDGVLSVWDLRQFSGTTVRPLARFTPHQAPITSVEWHPTDESMLAASDDNGVYVYDLSVEEDDTGADPIDLPAQLLFVHSGSEQFKEAHWHPQISSCLMSTALSGYSVFIPSNL